MGRKAEGQIYINDLEKFPCKDIGTIIALRAGVVTNTERQHRQLDEY